MQVLLQQKQIIYFFLNVSYNNLTIFLNMNIITSIVTFLFFKL